MNIPNLIVWFMLLGAVVFCLGLIGWLRASTVKNSLALAFAMAVGFLFGFAEGAVFITKKGLSGELPEIAAFAVGGVMTIAAAGEIPPERVVLEFRRYRVATDQSFKY